jgi:tRNA(Ile)-lysidine synthase
MANSRKSRSDKLSLSVAARISRLIPPGSRILVGLSGGVDSVVLLHLLHQFAPRYSWTLAALHVHHGISPNADSWAGFCATLCLELNISLHIEHVDIVPLRAHGLEAAARKLRHAAFVKQSCDFVALAHHADDQVETLFLQLLRGAGVRGASAMPALNSVGLIRPLLHSSREEILAYAAEHKLQWIEDESNADVSYPRNFLRHRLLPLMGEKFPAYRDTLSRSAQHFAEAGDLLDDLARIDAVNLFSSTASGGGGDGRDIGLPVTRLQSLSHARAKNLLRYYLYQLGAPMPQVVQLDDMLSQLCNAREDAAVCVAFGADWQLRRYRGCVYVLRALPEFDRNVVLRWTGQAELEWLALQRSVSFRQGTGSGISLAKLQTAQVTLRFRQGGEALRPHLHASTRTLKNLLQEHFVPPWQRDRLPLLYCGGDLVSIPGIAIAAEYQAKADENSLKLTLNNSA